MPSEFQFTFEGKPVDAREGQSIAAALLAAGERCLRIDEAGNAKGAVFRARVCEGQEDTMTELGSLLAAGDTNFI